MEQRKLDRISELTRIARERVLTEEELSERAALRAEYLEGVKRSVSAQLESTYLVDDNGNKTKLPKKQK
jgi:uncharacterized protein YnzC (UPF0291/DUF896 family)